MLQGYPFYGTGAAAPTADNVTMLDPVLEASVTGITRRGAKGYVDVMGISLYCDAPALGSRAELRVGNQPTPARVIDIFPNNDADMVSDPSKIMAYQDLGGIRCAEDEVIDIRLYDPGAAEIFSGVLWVEDYEPEIPIPKGQIVTLRFGGTNDGTTGLIATGFDMDSRKLINERLYTPFELIVRPEEEAKIVQACILRAEKDVMTIPPGGRMVFKSAPLQFTGQAYNNGQVVGKVQVSAGTKVEIIMKCIESEGQVKASSSSPTVDTVKPNTGLPGIIAAANLVGATGLKAPMTGVKLFGR
jgi:hypothetical protein